MLTRRKMLMGNWKMFKTIAEARSFAEDLCTRETGLVNDIDYAIFPPFTALGALVDAMPRHIKLGAQNMYYEEKGAFTGEISPVMLADLKIPFVLLGHSERRNVFGESDELIQNKMTAAVKHGLTPVLCVGEDLSERERNLTHQVVERQTVFGLKTLTPEEVAVSVIAYEPVWAIGSGKTATADDAEQVIQHIRSIVAREKGNAAAERVRILYGGSVKPDNIAAFLFQPNIDGALVGGASLEPASFVAMASAISSPKAGV